MFGNLLGASNSSKDIFMMADIHIFDKTRMEDVF